MLNYTLVLEDADGAQTNVTMGNRNLRIDGLEDNKGFMYHIRVANRLGYSGDSSPVEICESFYYSFSFNLNLAHCSHH